MEKVVIAGGGLCGALLGGVLAKEGYQIHLLEKRSDLRKGPAERGRSINLALSSRGIEALKLVGMDQAIKDLSIPMPVRALHQKDGTINEVPYSGRPGEYINSISRTGLNALLLDQLESFPNVVTQFESPVTAVDFTSSRVNYQSKGVNHSSNYDFLFGTDGAASAVRKSLYDIPYFSHTFSQDFLDYGYKELSIDPADNDGFRILKNALHIWPRGHLMMIALPNLDGSFTVTLFLPMHGKDSFEAIDRGAGIKAYFNEHFKGAENYFDDLEGQYAANPIGYLGTIRCTPWSVSGNVLLMGDAAHAIVPFYGQGMNAAFEDVHVLHRIMKENGGLNNTSMTIFDQTRKADCNAIAELAIDNFYEMRDHTANPVFLKKRAIETQLEKMYPDYFSKYSMVTFRPDMPYSIAMSLGRKQDAWLMQFASSQGAATYDLHQVYTDLKKFMAE